MTMKTDFGPKDFAEFCRTNRPAYHAGYYAMYSSWWDGITTDPNLMVVPVDDHMVHRGDGLFETFKCMDGAIYNLDAHLARLEGGARTIALELPWSRADIRRIVGAVLQAGGRRDGLVRIFASRGPGGHSANPYECPRPLLMVLAIRLPPPFMELHPEGAKVGVSGVPHKDGFFAQVKSVNYLPNVLMKKQAVDAGVEEADVPRAELEQAAEMLVFGTTPHVTAVTEFAGRPVGDGKPGPVWRELSRVFEEDLKNPALLTPMV